MCQCYITSGICRGHHINYIIVPRCPRLTPFGCGVDGGDPISRVLCGHKETIFQIYSLPATCTIIRIHFARSFRKLRPHLAPDFSPTFHRFNFSHASNFVGIIPQTDAEIWRFVVVPNPTELPCHKFALVSEVGETTHNHHISKICCCSKATERSVLFVCAKVPKGLNAQNP